MSWESLLYKVPMAAYKNRFLLQEWWVKLLAYVDTGATDVVIVGRPSVGKSLLCSHLHGEASNMTFQIPKSSTSVETKAIAIGKWTELVRVIPGQSTQERYLGLQEAFDKNNVLTAVVYVVDWGYTDVRNSTIKEKLIMEEGIDTIDKLREYNLKREILDLRSILDSIKTASANNVCPKKFIIAVNKVDLFSDKISDAEKYYNIEYDTEFTRPIKEMLNFIGIDNMRCVTVPISSWQTDLHWNNIVIKTNLGGREIEHQLTKNFIDAIVER